MFSIKEDYTKDFEIVGEGLVDLKISNTGIVTKYEFDDEEDFNKFNEDINASVEFILEQYNKICAWDKNNNNIIKIIDFNFEKVLIYSLELTLTMIDNSKIIVSNDGNFSFKIIERTSIFTNMIIDVILHKSLAAKSIFCQRQLPIERKIKETNSMTSEHGFMDVIRSVKDVTPDFYEYCMSYKHGDTTINKNSLIGHMISYLTHVEGVDSWADLIEIYAVSSSYTGSLYELLLEKVRGHEKERIKSFEDILTDCADSFKTDKIEEFLLTVFGYANEEDTSLVREALKAIVHNEEDKIPYSAMKFMHVISAFYVFISK